jgi:hypothetical protein
MTSVLILTSRKQEVPTSKDGGMNCGLYDIPYVLPVVVMGMHLTHRILPDDSTIL